MHIIHKKSFNQFNSLPSRENRMITRFFLTLSLSVLNLIGQCLQTQDHLTDFYLKGYGGHKSHSISGSSDSSESSSNDSSDSNDTSTHATEHISIPKIRDKFSTELPILY